MFRFILVLCLLALGTVQIGALPPSGGGGGGGNDDTNKPTKKPTKKPTLPQPTKLPTKAPTKKPLLRPVKLPLLTKSPTLVGSIQPISVIPEDLPNQPDVGP